MEFVTIAPDIYALRVWPMLSKILGRELTEAEQLSIVENTERYAAMRTSSKSFKLAPSLLARELKRFAKLSDECVWEEYKLLPVLAQTEIVGALFAKKLPYTTMTIEKNSPSTITAAANTALEELEAGNSGRKIDGYAVEFVKYILAQWKALGRDDCEVYENDYHPHGTPFVQFAAVLMEVTQPDDCPTNSGVVKWLKANLERNN